MGNAGADPGDTHYPIVKLNRWFAISSILFLISVVWMVLADWNREWKQWQRQYQSLEANFTEAKLNEYSSPEKVKELTAANEAFTKAQAGLETKRGEIATVTEELTRKKSDLYNADQHQRRMKADLDWVKYLVEEDRIHNPGNPNARQEEVTAAYALVDEAARNFKQAEVALGEVDRKLKSLKSEKNQAEANLTSATLERDRLAKNLELIRPKTAEGKITKLIRDMPGLDFLAPSLTVNKVVLDNLFFDLKFPGAKKRRVDMCITCHVPIDKLDSQWAEQANPMKSHPRMDLYLSDSSPHPMKDFGCTICHNGSGETVSFVHADHAPRDEKQKTEWQEKHHWHKMHHWELPMYPLQYTEASCYQCHSGHMELLKEDAPRLYEASKLVEQAGCYGCHKIQQGPWKDLRKVGPNLKKIKSKVSPEWAYAWVINPTDFRPSTWMPQIFHLSNATDPARAHLKIKEREDVAVHAILSYLWKHSEGFEAPPPPVVGNVEKGKETISLVGCLACHQVDGVNQANDWNDFGPDLSGIGSKLSQNWLYAWVKNPKAYFPETKMPDLRLSDQEAADIAAYLASLKKADWNPTQPKLDTDLLKVVANEFITASVAPSDEEKALKAALTNKTEKESDLLQYVGRKYIARQGCFGCHEISGFEKESAIGTELSEWGSKNLDTLDFGLFLNEGMGEKRMPKNRQQWAHRKILDPRVFDEGKIKQPDELLRMPKFRFTPEQAELVTTFLTGLLKPEIPPQAMPHLSDRKKTLADGAFLIRQNNCQSCHVFDYEKVTFKHPIDGLVSVRGAYRYDEDEESHWVQLREPAPSFAADERSEVGSFVSFEKDALVSKTSRNGGGLFESLEKQASVGYSLSSSDPNQPLLRQFTGVELEPFAPPSLVGEGQRVQSDWLYEFLKKPYTIRPAVRTKMPTFGFSDRDASTISQWFVRREEEKYPADFTRSFRSFLKMSRLDFAKEANLGKRGAEALELMERLESGGRVGEDIFPKILKFAEAKNFRYDAAPGLPFEVVRERSDEYRREKNQKVRDYFLKARDLVNLAEAGACYNCHLKNGVSPPDPFTAAPDLSTMPERMRPDWLRRWLMNPSAVLPNTKMPLPAVKSGTAETIFPGSFEDRVEAMKDYLMNFERVPAHTGSTQ